MIYRNYIKRFLDILVCIICFPFVLPVLLVAAVVIVVDDGFPIFYNANRIGKDKKEFKMYKLRSMKNNSPDIRMPDGSTYNAPDDPRLTRSGKLFRELSVDELPQLLNVFLGHMSLIGPRPDLPDEALLYDEEEWHRLDVRPGITGYSQAFFRNSIPTKEKYKNDLYYVENVSFKFDVKILWQTLKSVIRSKDIYAEPEDVRPEIMDNKTGVPK